MKEDVKYKLDQIATVWNDFIWDNNFCKQTIKFTTEVRTNYFGDILGYFQDTFDIIFDDRESQSYSDRFSNQISLLQCIYVQQDFVEELLLIFKCGLDKGDLKKDPNYFINREIRNELVGHPIRKHKGQFISSCLFGYKGARDRISYLRYHRDNNYKFESMEFVVSDIILRHKEFLEKYFDEILSKLKGILSDFRLKLENIEALMHSKSFAEILNLLSVFYEAIFEYDFIYDKEFLLQIYVRKDEHRRYQNVIDKFYDDLKSSLKEKKEYSIKLFEPREVYDGFKPEIPLLDISEKINFSDISSKTKAENIERPVTYHYELGKLATKRNPMDFTHFGNSLKIKCANNQTVLKELKHMESNIYDEIEYYSAYRLICTELREDDD